MKVLSVLLVVCLVCAARADISLSFGSQVFWPTVVPEQPGVPGGTGPIFGLVNDPDIPAPPFSGTATIVGAATSLGSITPATGPVSFFDPADVIITFTFGDGPEFTYNSETLAVDAADPVIHVISQVWRGMSVTHDFVSGANPYRLRIEGFLWSVSKQFDDFTLVASGAIVPV